MIQIFGQKFHSELLDEKSCLFRATNITKNHDKEKYLYSGYAVAFDRKSLWIFNKRFARNVIIFRIDNSSSSNTDSLKNDFLTLGEGNTFGMNESFGAQVKKY